MAEVTNAGQRYWTEKLVLLKSDLDNAIGAIDYAHSHYCISSDNCDCHEVAARLTVVMEGLPDDPE